MEISYLNDIIISYLSLDQLGDEAFLFIDNSSYRWMKEDFLKLQNLRRDGYDLTYDDKVGLVQQKLFKIKGKLENIPTFQKFLKRGFSKDKCMIACQRGFISYLYKHISNKNFPVRDIYKEALLYNRRTIISLCAMKDKYIVKNEDLPYLIDSIHLSKIIENIIYIGDFRYIIDNINLVDKFILSDVLKILDSYIISDLKIYINFSIELKIEPIYSIAKRLKFKPHINQIILMLSDINNLFPNISPKILTEMANRHSDGKIRFYTYPPEYPNVNFVEINYRHLDILNSYEDLCLYDCIKNKKKIPLSLIDNPIKDKIKKLFHIFPQKENIIIKD